MVVAVNIPNPKAASSKGSRVAGLAHYIAVPELDNSTEKCIYLGTRGFMSSNFESQISEMTALASECVKSKDPIRHDLITFKEHEIPTAKQVEEIIDLYLKELGLEGHQVIYGLHADTNNMHIHIEVNRIHSESLKAIKIDRGFDKEALQRVCARVEHAQGWEREKNGRYYVQADGSMSDRPDRDEKARKPSAQARNMEVRTGIKSAQRIVIEDATPILKSARTWFELHELLDAVGIRYERARGGAIVFVGDVGVKAGIVETSARFSALQKKLGAFEPKSQEKSNVYFQQRTEGQEPDVLRRPVTNVIDRTREPLTARQFEPDAQWNEYSIARGEHYKQRRLEAVATRQRHLYEREVLKISQRAERLNVLPKLQLGESRAGLTNTLRELLAFEQSKAKLDVKDRHAAERAALKARYPQFPGTYEQWLVDRGELGKAEQWRYRQNPEDEPCKIGGFGRTRPAPVFDISDFIAAVDGYQVRYSNAGGYGFVDKGRNIVIGMWRDEDTTLVALRLAAKKWGSFTAAGNDEYISMCMKLAAEHGFNIVNPELQAGIQVQRDLLQQKTQVISDGLESLDHGGLDRDRYERGG